MYPNVAFAIEARVRGELASSAAIVPGREDKGKGVYILRVFDVFTSRDCPSGIARARDTRVRRSLYRLFQHNRVSPPGGVLPGALGAAESLPLAALPDLARMLTAVDIPANRFRC